MNKAFGLLILLFSVAVFGQEEITIKSRASIEYPIEKITVVVGLKTTDTDIQKADNGNYKKSLSIINLLVSYGYAKEDILTLRSGTNEQYRYKDKKKYYTSESRYSFVLTDLESYDTIKEELIKNGAESVTYQKIMDDEEKYKKQAYIKAIEKAKQKADLIAKEFGGKRIQLKKIIDGGVSYQEHIKKLKNELTGEEPGITQKSASQVMVRKESSITNITGVARATLLIVFEVIE